MIHDLGIPMLAKPYLRYEIGWWFQWFFMFHFSIAGPYSHTSLDTFVATIRCYYQPYQLYDPAVMNHISYYMLLSPSIC